LARRRALAIETLASTFPSATTLLRVPKAFLLEAIVTAAEARLDHAGMHSHPADTAASVVVGMPRLWPVGLTEQEALRHLTLLVGYRIAKQAKQLTFYRMSELLHPELHEPDRVEHVEDELDLQQRLHDLAATLPAGEADFVRRLARHTEVWPLLSVRGAAREVARKLGMPYAAFRQLLHRVRKRIVHARVTNSGASLGLLMSSGSPRARNIQKRRERQLREQRALGGEEIPDGTFHVR
jgi:hypothetical protein